MALAYSVFTTTPTDIVADLKTKILLSSDWSNPTGNVVQCTTTRGATMAVKLDGAAADNNKAQLEVYRLFSGGVGTDAITRYLTYKGASGNSAEVIRCIVSAGKEHLFISVEGPRAGETYADSATLGSLLSTFALADIVPYYSGDTVAAVACVGNPATGLLDTNVIDNTDIVVSRDQADASAWVRANLASVQFPAMPAATATYHAYGRMLNPYAKADSYNAVLWPYLVVEQLDGLRGRLNGIYFGGFNMGALTAEQVVGCGAGQEVTYDSKTYTLLPATRTYATSHVTPFGMAPNASASTGKVAWSPLVAVQKA